ncbi:hypothetical protein [Stieleria varia]|nr:hypothetical protein [Stieleria varia]
MNKPVNGKSSPKSSIATAVAIAKTQEQEQAERRKTAYKLVSLFLALALLAAFALNASAQAPKYDSIPLGVNLDEAQKKAMESSAKAYITARDLSSLDARQQGMAKFYFTKYIPSEITQPRISPESSTLLLDVQKRLASAMRSPSPVAARTVAGWLYTGLKPVATGNYPPAGRISAIMCISRLDSGYANGVPVPNSNVLTDLLPIYRDAKTPDAVRAAALQGIDRYVRYTPIASIAAAGKTALLADMNQLVQADPPAGRDPMAHAYLQRFAVNILSNLSNDANLAKTLVSISTKATAPDLVALHSAAKFGSVESNAVKGVVPTPKDVVKNWSTRAVETMKSEITRLKALNKQGAMMTDTRVKQPLDPEKYLGIKSDDEENKPTTNAMSMEDSMMDSMDSSMMESYGSGMDGMEGMDSMMDGMGGYGMMSGMVAAAKPKPPEVVASLQKLNYMFEQIHLGATGSAQLGTPRNPAGLLAAVDPASKPLVENWLIVLTEVINAVNENKLDNERAYLAALEENVIKLEAFAEAPKAAADPSDTPTIPSGLEDLLGGL